MNEIYELAIESAEVELLLTEGFADKAKDIAKKAVVKIKEIIKKILKKIADIIDKGIGKYQKLELGAKDFIHDNDNRQISILKAYLVHDKLIKTLRDKIDTFYSKIRRGESYDQDKDFDVDDEIREMKDTIDIRVDVSIKEAVDIVNRAMPIVETNLKYLKTFASPISKQMEESLKSNTEYNPNGTDLYFALNEILYVVSKMVNYLKFICLNSVSLMSKIRTIR